MQTQIKTSVIIPIYNTENYLDECIQSVLNQTQKEIEIILVNDGSTDSSGEIIERYAREYDNITAIHQENQKPGAARNNGMKRARGEYIYFLDSDDSIAIDMLERCYSFCKEQLLDFVFFDAWEFFDKENIFSKSYDRVDKNIEMKVYEGKTYWIQYLKNEGIFFCAPLTYVNKKYIDTHNLLFEEGIFYEDMDWILRMYREAKRVAYLPEKLYLRRYRGGSITQSNYLEIHFNSVTYIVWKLLELYTIYEDKESKQMACEIMDTMLQKAKHIIENIDVDKIYNNLFMFINNLLTRCNELSVLNVETNIKILRLMTVCIKGIDLTNNGLWNKYQNYHHQVCNQISNKYKLQESIDIVIYGIGKMCDEILDWYEGNAIQIRANIKFMVTKADFKSYKGYPVWGVEEMKDMEVDYIIIASTKFAEEMKKNLQVYNIRAKEYFTTFGKLSDI